MATQYTKALAEYASKLKYEDLPREVVDQAKMVTLHTIGIALASYPTEQGTRAIALAKRMGGAPEATIFGDGAKVSCMSAGFANGTMVDALDWGDCSWTGHPSASVVPAALAVSEVTGATGKDYLTAVVAAYEVYQRIAMAVQPSDDWDWLVKGWGLTTWQTFAATIPAAKLLKFDAQKTAQAIGIAGLVSPIVNPKPHVTMSDVKPYQYGLITKDGITAALLAESGIDGLHDVLDGENGYWVTISDQCDWSWFTKGLGKDYLIMETFFKHWPSNMWIQLPLEAIDAIARKHEIPVREVAEIIVDPPFQNRTAYKPEGYMGAKEAEFSIPFNMATYLLDPKPGPNWYTKEKLTDPELLALAGKVKTVGKTAGLHESFKKFRAGSFPEVTVKIVLKNGKEYSETVRFPKGHPKNRLTFDEGSEMFRRGASFALNAKKTEAAIDRILHLDELPDVRTLAQQLYN
jgi:2-methylcitrate dehydratase PrpD